VRKTGARSRREWERGTMRRRRRRRRRRRGVSGG
jgi:hypothetical protein